MIDISEERLAELLLDIQNWIDTGKVALTQRLQVEANWIVQYESKNKKTAGNLMWANASNLDIGGFLTFSHVEGFHSKAMSVLASNDPWASFVSVDPDEEFQANKFFWHKLTNEVGIKKVIDQWVHNAAICGTRYQKAVWEEEYSKKGERWYLPVDPEVAALPDGQERDAAIFAEIEKFLKTKLDDIQFEYEGKRKDGASRYHASSEKGEVKVYIKVGKGNLVTVELMHVIKSFDGVKVYPVLPEDFYKSPGPLQTCKWVIHRVWLTWNEVVERVNSGLWHNIDLDEDFSQSSQKNSELELQREAASGVYTQYSGGNKLYKFLECYVRDDFDNDGIMEDMLFVMFEDPKKFVREDLLSMAGFDYRPFAPIHLQPIPDSDPDTYAWGIPQMIREIALEETAAHNLTMDSATFSGIPCFFYPDNINLKAEIMRFEPGRGIPIPVSDGSVQESIYVPQFSVNLQPMFQLQDRMGQLMSAVDGNADNQPLPKAPKTASQSQQIATQLNYRFNVLFDRCLGSVSDVSGIAGLLEIIRSLYQRFSDPLEVIEKTGMAVTYNFPKHSKALLHFDVTSDVMNEQITQARSQSIMQIATNPMFHEMGITTPDSVYNALKHALRILKVKNIEDYLHKSQVMSIPQPQEDAQMLRGIAMPVHPADNDMEHLQELQEFQEWVGQQAQGLVSPKVSMLLQQHQAAHEAQMKKKQQVQMANAAQQSGGTQPGSQGSPAPTAIGGQGAPTPTGHKDSYQRHHSG